MPVINWECVGTPVKFTAYTDGVVIDILTASSNPSCVISSLMRSPEEQAEAMHTNCLEHGAAAQMTLYDPPGQAVIRVFVVDHDKSATDTLADMTAEIRKQGPYEVSHHCGDAALINVIDVSAAPQKLRNAEAFVAACKADKRVSKVIDERKNNGCIHLEIPQLEC